jgi:hypothetical protein
VLEVKFYYYPGMAIRSLWHFYDMRTSAENVGVGRRPEVIGRRSPRRVIHFFEVEVDARVNELTVASEAKPTNGIICHLIDSTGLTSEAIALSSARPA